VSATATHSVWNCGNNNKTAASNYRPVSLMSQICEVFEVVVQDEVVQFFDKHKLIRDSQHGSWKQ